MNTALGNGTLGDLILYAIVILLPTLLVIYCIYWLILLNKVKRKAKDEIINRDVIYNDYILISLNHTLGLPVPENTLCKICAYSDKYEIKVNNQSFYLSKDKVTAIDLKTEAEIQNSYLTSAGSYTKSYGPLGELINNRTENSTGSVDISYLIITYTKENAVDYIAFNTTAILEALQLIEEFNTRHDRIQKEIYL